MKKDILSWHGKNVQFVLVAGLSEKIKIPGKIIPASASSQLS